MIIISDDSDIEKHPTYQVVPRRLNFTTTMSVQSKLTSTSIDKSASTSKSVDELLGTHDLESSDDSDSSLFEFARDVVQRNEAVKAL